MAEMGKVEIWKPINEYPDYMISSLGRVKSLKRNKELILKTPLNKFGYPTISLCKENTHKVVLVHRLVAQAFIPNTNNLPQINHIDEDKTNNCVENLEWCTAKYNTNYGTRNIRALDKTHKKISKPVLQFSLDGELVRKWETTYSIEKNMLIHHSDITKCCKGKQKTAGGYIWKYAIKFNVFDLAIEK